jgi:cytoskeletal protein CcmA (bactofilin family)
MADNPTASRPSPSSSGSLLGATKLGATSSFDGTLEGHEDTLIEGRFKGRIAIPSGSLTVGRGAKVEADVKVRVLNLLGELTGNVTAADRVIVTETARLNGDVRTPRISIANGAQFKGGIKIEKA